MDAGHFDALTRLLATGSRRRLIGSFSAVALGALAPLLGMTESEADKNRGKKKKKKDDKKKKKRACSAQMAAAGYDCPMPYPISLLTPPPGDCFVDRDCPYYTEPRHKCCPILSETGPTGVLACMQVECCSNDHCSGHPNGPHCKDRLCGEACGRYFCYNSGEVCVTPWNGAPYDRQCCPTEHACPGSRTGCCSCPDSCSARAIVDPPGSPTHACFSCPP